MSVTFVVVLLTWVLFRADNLTLAGRHSVLVWDSIPATTSVGSAWLRLYTPLSLLAMAVARTSSFSHGKHDMGQLTTDLGTCGLAAAAVPHFGGHDVRSGIQSILVLSVLRASCDRLEPRNDSWYSHFCA